MSEIKTVDNMSRDEKFVICVVGMLDGPCARWDSDRQGLAEGPCPPQHVLITRSGNWEDALALEERALLLVRQHPSREC